MSHTVASADLHLMRERRHDPTPRQRVLRLMEENARLERTVAELRLKNILLEEALSRRST